MPRGVGAERDPARLPRGRLLASQRDDVTRQGRGRGRRRSHSRGAARARSGAVVMETPSRMRRRRGDGCTRHGNAARTRGLKPEWGSRGSGGRGRREGGNGEPSGISWEVGRGRGEGRAAGMAAPSGAVGREIRGEMR